MQLHYKPFVALLHSIESKHPVRKLIDNIKFRPRFKSKAEKPKKSSSKKSYNVYLLFRKRIKANQRKKELIPQIAGFLFVVFELFLKSMSDWSIATTQLDRKTRIETRYLYSNIQPTKNHFEG